MKFLQIVLLLVCIASPVTMAQSGKGWRGIVPLHSTRADVERLLGIPKQSGRAAIYQIGDEQVAIEYAVSPCKGSLLGWNVLSDTVLEIDVVPRKKTQFAELKINESKYVKPYGHVANLEYINLDEGIKYTVLEDGTLLSVSYIPSAKDNHLRCPGFPPYDGGLTQYRPFDSYGNVSLANEEGRLDNFAISLQAEPDLRGYIIVYAGRNAYIDEAKKRSERAREYLVNKCGISVQRVIAIDGGFREELTTELYLIPSSAPPPTPTPTIPSNEIRIVSSREKD